MELRHLEIADRHIAQGRRHIADQENRITKLARYGHDMTLARKLLENFYELQVLHKQHRDRILKKLEQRTSVSLNYTDG